MLESLLVRVMVLAFSLGGVVLVNDHVMEGALCLGTEGDSIVITDGCFLHDRVDLPTGAGDDLFAGLLDADRPSPATPRPAVVAR